MATTREPQAPPQGPTDRAALGSSKVLPVAIGLAILAHLVLLAVEITRPEVERRPVIEITLDAPEADRSLDAGRETDEINRELPADPMLAGQRGPASPTETLKEDGQGPQQEGAWAASDTPRRLSTQDQIDQLYEQVNAALRTGYATSRTQGGPAGRYLARWKRQVEAYGNQNYPDALVQQNLSGQVILEVTIGKQGHVLNLAIRRSSGNPVLDNAARNLLQAAAPYPAFPDELAAKHDRLVITRTWVFTSDRRLLDQGNSARFDDVSAGPPRAPDARRSPP
ncbi:TonB family protein [Guyparkeria hydrothermalis]|uniref:energy transducer TonB n=1 Tax=Guyparkeria hydrothermalis TaxID=923 RepID=UPI00202260A2|nr:TonB family protein [Guyparkeria hydrothermalis]MCL7751099.1 TonB family protein [Guyparkeria hydrothermalis]